MRFSRRHAWIAASLGAALALLPAVASSETTPIVDAVNVGTYSHYWSPTQVSIATGGEVTLRNESLPEVRHGVHWVGGPAQPSCDPSVPVGATETAANPHWVGNCKFTQAGTYTFYCTVHGPEMTGTVTVTIPGAPSATTGGAGSVSQTGATLEGTVNPNEEATTYYFNYGTTASYGLKTPEESAGEGSVGKTVSAPVSGLAPGTTYHYQLVAKNGVATTPGADRTFTTESPPGPPTATTGVATALSETEATLKGTVDPGGQATEYFFEWGTDTSYGQLTSELPAGADHSGHVESATLTKLIPGTVYHFRLVAENASGPSFGADKQFITASPPLPTSPSPTTTLPITTTPLVTPPPPKPEEARPLGPSLFAGSLKLTVPRHGSSVRGSIQVGAGGRLEVDLLAKGTLLGKARSSTSKTVRVGRLVRQSVSAGKVSFSLALTAQGKRALARHHSLPVTVKVALTPAQGGVATVTRNVTLRM